MGFPKCRPCVHWGPAVPFSSTTFPRTSWSHSTMSKRFASLAAVLVLAACADTAVEPSVSNPNFAATPAGAPLGKGNCHPKPVHELQTGRINPGSCLFNEQTGRRGAYYQ